LIKGFNEPTEFIEKWSNRYSYSNEYKYHNNIDHVLNDKQSFLEVFKWKNGTGDVIYEKKLTVIEGFYKKIEILRNLRLEFSWDLFENEFEPTKNSPIWKIFLLHIIDPKEFPIYDQHVFRFYNFVKTGVITEIPTNLNQIYDGYKNEYKIWFNQIRREFSLDPKDMDKSFVTYGKVLKSLKGLPIEIIER